MAGDLENEEHTDEGGAEHNQDHTEAANHGERVDQDQELQKDILRAEAGHTQEEVDAEVQDQEQRSEDRQRELQDDRHIARKPDQDQEVARLHEEREGRDQDRPGT